MRKQRKDLWRSVRDRDITQRYDSSRKYVSIFQRLVDAAKMDERVSPLLDTMMALDANVQLAVNDYYTIEQQWDWMPIVRKQVTSPNGSMPFPYTPMVYRRIKGMDKTAFVRWLCKIEVAQKALPRLILVLGFDAKQALDFYGRPKPPHRAIRIRPTKEGDKP